MTPMEQNGPSHRNNAPAGAPVVVRHGLIAARDEVLSKAFYRPSFRTAPAAHALVIALQIAEDFAPC